MAKVLSSCPMILYSTKSVSNFPQARNAHTTPFGHKKRTCCVLNTGSQFLHQPLVERRLVSSRQRGLNAKSLESGEEDNQALEAVLKLYSAIKNKNIHELSNIIGDECRCVCNFFSFFQSFNGKQQVLDFFKYVIRILGNNIEFVVQPTIHDGMNVGVSWRLQWTKTHMPLGKGFSFYICQIYQGKVFIRNVEMFIEPLFHMEPFRLKIMEYVMSIVEKMSYCNLSKDKMKAAILILFLMVIILLFLKPGLY